MKQSKKLIDINKRFNQVVVVLKNQIEFCNYTIVFKKLERGICFILESI